MILPFCCGCVTKKAPVLPECTGQGRELNFRGTTLLRRALAGMALRAGMNPASAR